MLIEWGGEIDSSLSLFILPQTFLIPWVRCPSLFELSDYPELVLTNILIWLCWNCLFAYMCPPLDSLPHKGRARSSSVSCCLSKCRTKCAVIQYLLREWERHGRDSVGLRSCLWEVRRKKKFLLNNWRKNKWSIIAVLGLYSQHGQFLTV